MLFSSIGQTVRDLVLLWYMGIGEEMMVPFQKKGEEMMEERGKKIIGRKRIPQGIRAHPTLGGFGAVQRRIKPTPWKQSMADILLSKD